MKLKYNLINIKELFNGSTSVNVIYKTTQKSIVGPEDVQPGLNIIYLTRAPNNYLNTIYSLEKANDGVQLIIIPQYDNLQYQNRADNANIQNFDNFKVYTFKYIKPEGTEGWVKSGEFHSEDGQTINSYDYINPQEGGGR